MKAMFITVQGGSLREMKANVLSLIEEEEKMQKFVLDLLLFADTRLKELTSEVHRHHDAEEVFIDEQKFHNAGAERDAEKEAQNELVKYLLEKYPEVELGEGEGMKKRLRFLLEQ